MKTDVAIKYKNATNKLLLLDYDGTLVDFTPIPYQAMPSERLLSVLLKLNSNTNTRVVVITGRGYLDIEKMIGFLPIGIVAEHGAMIKEGKSWEKRFNGNDLWKETVFPLLREITSGCPGSFVEEKYFSLAWHYRNAELQKGYTQSRELIRILEKENYSDLRILDGNKVVEIMPEQSGKGKITQYLLNRNNYDYVLSIGDDKTDEDMFKVLLDDEKYFTIKVGQGDTSAKAKLENVEQVILFLEQLSK